MSRITTGIVIVAVALISFAAVAEVSAGTAYQKETQATVSQLEQYIVRTKLLTDEMDRQGASEARCQMLKKMSESTSIVALQLQVLMKESQRMMDSKTLMRDEQLQRDAMALREQVKSIADRMENTLQYMEHMSYRFGKLSSKTTRQDVAKNSCNRLDGDRK